MTETAAEFATRIIKEVLDNQDKPEILQSFVMLEVAKRDWAIHKAAIAKPEIRMPTKVRAEP